MTRRKTVLDLQRMKTDNRKIAMVTAYDYSMARIVDQTEVDCVLVGDSLGMVIQGESDTLSVTMEDMIYHSRCVSRGLSKAHLTVDMPFMSYQTSVEDAVRNAGRLVKEGGAQSVKLEGGLSVVPQIRAIVETGIPVIAHLGLTPQAVNALGGFRVQGKSSEAQEKMKRDALAIQEAGASLLVMEMVPAPFATELTEILNIPTIGIGAGIGCDGQVLVCNDLLGLDMSFQPRFLKRFATLEERMVNAFSSYVSEVRQKTFPAPKHSFGVTSKKQSKIQLEKLY
jgi:3-methyl-2-oxobutanoate hydroxymethyltransferase